MTTGRLQDKVVILTGGTSGIGRAAVKLFCQHGAKVVIGARNEGAGAEVVQEVETEGNGEAFFVKTDVSIPEQVENLIEQTVARHSRVDVLYGNSGILPMSTAPDTSIETWRRCIDVNLGGNFYLAKYGIPALIATGGNTILFTSSELGTVGASEMVAYCASKGGLINMTRALAIDCAPHGIRVNSLAPGPIETPMLRKMFDDAEDPEELEKIQTEPILLKRFGNPEEIAEVALFLVSEASSYMTGAVVVADGGATAWYGL
ncbi:MAG: SDR family oxidoreductase [Anaerolineales bacterium]|nr:SDR family oxidoreductase [Anaerolineales bacterium]